jgi:hypothetical protein
MSFEKAEGFLQALAAVDGGKNPNAVIVHARQRLQPAVMEKEKEVGATGRIVDTHEHDSSQHTSRVGLDGGSDDDDVDEICPDCGGQRIVFLWHFDPRAQN